jgi:hypothetical protein
MYNTKYICSYQNKDIFLEEEEKLLSQEEKDFILNCLYRNDLLYIFDIEDFDKCEYKKKLFDELYEKVKLNSFLHSCIKKLASDFNNETEEFGIVLFYSFELLYLAHPCVSEFLETGLVSQQNMNLLKEKVFTQ